MNPMWAFGLYYIHVCIMIIFNSIFNSEHCITGIYIFDILLNSLSSTYAYTYYKYRGLLGKVKEKKKKRYDDEVERFKGHQATLVRQGMFYAIIVLENLFLTGVAILRFPSIDKHVLDDGYTKVCFNFQDLVKVVVAIWVLHFVQLVLLVLYYANHPSSVSVNPQSFQSKRKVGVSNGEGEGVQ